MSEPLPIHTPLSSSPVFNNVSGVEYLEGKTFPTLKNDGAEAVIKFYEDLVKHNLIDVKTVDDGKGNVRVDILYKYLRSKNSPDGIKAEIGLFDTPDGASDIDLTTGKMQHSTTISLGCQDVCSLACLSCPSAYAPTDGNKSAERMIFEVDLVIKESKRVGRKITLDSQIQTNLTGDGDPGVNQIEVQGILPYVRQIHPGLTEVLTSTAGLLNSVDKNADAAIEVKEIYGVTFRQMISLHGSDKPEREEIITKPPSTENITQRIFEKSVLFYERTRHVLGDEKARVRINYQVVGPNPYYPEQPRTDFNYNNKPESAVRLTQAFSQNPDAAIITFVENNPIKHSKAPGWSRPHPDPATEALRKEHNWQNVVRFHEQVADLNPLLHTRRQRDGGAIEKLRIGCGQAGDDRDDRIDMSNSPIVI